MDIATARSLAEEWVRLKGRDVPGFAGAFLAGSTNDLPGEAALDATSDLDVMVVLQSTDIPVKPGKFRYRGVLLEVSYLESDAIRDAVAVLGHYHLGRAIATSRILADPTGHLSVLKDEVARHFADRTWIETRVRQAAETVRLRLDSITQDLPFEEQVMAWLFAAGGLPHVVLVAGLRNPTVRKRYVAVGELFDEQGIDRGIYGEMLDLLDPKRVSIDRCGHHLGVLSDAFDAAGGVVRSPFFFASDLSAEARPLAIDGSRELIEAGLHREALFWIIATFCRCQIVLHADASGDLGHRWDHAFGELMADVGIHSFDDLRRRGDAVRAALPEILNVAQRLVDVAAMPEPA